MLSPRIERLFPFNGESIGADKRPAAIRRPLVCCLPGCGFLFLLCGQCRFRQALLKGGLGCGFLTFLLLPGFLLRTRLLLQQSLLICRLLGCEFLLGFAVCFRICRLQFRLLLPYITGRFCLLYGFRLRFSRCIHRIRLGFRRIYM